MKKESTKEVAVKLILGFQHLIAMFGSTILVPVLTGLDPSVALFCAGLGTLIFHLCTKGKVPVFLGSSFAFIPVIIAVKEQYGSLRYAQGGLFVAGLIYVLVSFLIKKIGMDRIKAVLPPQVVGPMIMVIGLNLLPTAFGMVKTNYILAAITLGTALLVNFFGKGFFKQIGILCGVTLGYVIAIIMGLVNSAPIKSADFFDIPKFSLPIFNIGAIVIIAPVVVAVFMEHIGDITTNGKVVGKNFIEDPGLNRTLLGDGLATIIASCLGGPANTTYGENTGVLAITKNYNPQILRIAAVFAIILSFIGKFGQVIKGIPSPVMGGISVMLFSMIALIGVKTIRDEKVKFNWKNIIVMVSILFVGLSANFGLNIAIPITKTVSLNGLSLAAIIGVVLNLILNGINRSKQSQEVKEAV